ncbi:MAG: IS4 family transposase [bacterium]
MFSQKFKRYSRLNDNCFIRDRQLYFETLIIFLIFGAVKTLAVGIPEFFEKFGKKNIACTKQAFSKARKNLSYFAFIYLNDILVGEHYKSDFNKYKGYRLLAVDGSKIELPHGDVIAKEFGGVTKEKKLLNRARAISIYDITNKMIVQAKLYNYSTSERDCLVEQLQELKRKGRQINDVIVADRGFPSLSVFIELKKMGYNFVIRYNGENFLKEFEEFAKIKCNDMNIIVNPKEVYRRKPKKVLLKATNNLQYGEIELRVVKIKLKSGTIEYLITSFLDKKEMTRQNLRNIYKMRWEEEENFKYQKYTTEIENFSGKCGENINQDYHSRILAINLHLSILRDANKQIKKEVKKKKTILKHKEYEANKNVSYGILNSYIIKLITDNSVIWDNIYAELLSKITRHKIAKRPERNYERRNKDFIKHPINIRRAI